MEVVFVYNEAGARNFAAVAVDEVDTLVYFVDIDVVVAGVAVAAAVVVVVAAAAIVVAAVVTVAVAVVFFVASADTYQTVLRIVFSVFLRRGCRR